MTTPKVYTAMLAVQKALAEIGVQKTDRNDFSNYMYRGIDAVMNAIAPLLPENGLLIIPSNIDMEQSDRQTKKGDTQIHTVAVVEYTFVSVEDGSTHTVIARGEAMDTSDKSMNQADTAAYKNMLFKTFCIPVAGQDDADSKSPEAGTRTSARAVPDNDEKKKWIDDNGFMEHVDTIKARFQAGQTAEGIFADLKKSIAPVGLAKRYMDNIQAIGKDMLATTELDPELSLDEQGTEDDDDIPF